MVMNDELEECGWKWLLPILDTSVPTLPYNIWLLWKTLHYHKFGLFWIKFWI